MNKATTLFVALAAITPLAQAHPGQHSHDLWATVMHFFSEPDHVAMLGLGLLAVFGLGRLLKRKKQDLR
jgi:hydrogenase/urease accessory protein HupE